MQLEHHCCDKAKMVVDGKCFREIESNCWSPERRIQEMDATGLKKKKKKKEKKKKKKRKKRKSLESRRENPHADRFMPGVDVQVLSTVPVMFNYWVGVLHAFASPPSSFLFFSLQARPEHTADLARYLNDHIADVVKKYPSR